MIAVSIREELPIHVGAGMTVQFIDALTWLAILTTLLLLFMQLSCEREVTLGHSVQTEHPLMARGLFQESSSDTPVHLWSENIIIEI